MSAKARFWTIVDFSLAAYWAWRLSTASDTTDALLFSIAIGVSLGLAAHWIHQDP